MVLLKNKIDITRRTLNFGIRIINLASKIRNRYPFSVTDQLVKSATSVGANVHEAQSARTKKEFY
ncbi:four helix bundle protein, partial [Patescibacteria group bacterium]